MAQFSYDPNQHKLSETPEVLQDGWYPAQMIESDIVPTAKNDGFRLATVFQIIDGPGAGRKVKNGYNIANPSDKAVEISMDEIKTMQACMGIFSPIQDSIEMHNHPLQIRLKKPKDSDYSEIKGYKTINGLDAKDAMSGGTQLPPMQHQQQPAQGFGQPAPTPYAAPAAAVDPTAGWQRQNGHRLNPATNAWELDTPAAPPPPPPPPYAAPAAPAAPSWAPPAASIAPPAPPAPPQPSAPPTPPSWTANPAPPAPPSWAHPPQ